MKHLSFDATISALDVETSAFGAATGMENWNQDHPERYNNFCGLFIKFQATECGPGPARVIGPAPPRSSKVTESMYKYLQTHIEVLKLCILKSVSK